MASSIQQRLLDLSTDILSNPASDIAFQHSIMCQTSLPATRPPDDVLAWERRQGRATLLVEAGKVMIPRTGISSNWPALWAEGAAAADAPEQRGGAPAIARDPD